MADYYFVKANRDEWRIPLDGGIPTDWENFHVGESHPFATWTKNQAYWKSLKKGDVIIGQSIYAAKKPNPDKKSKKKQSSKAEFTYLPRISAIVQVEQEERYSDLLKTDAVTLKKVIHLRPVFITKEIISELSDIEPFKPGYNRFTITKLNEEEFNRIIVLIKRDNPDIKNELKKYL